MLINLMTAWKESTLLAILHERQGDECKEAEGPVFAQSSFRFDIPLQH